MSFLNNFFGLNKDQIRRSSDVDGLIAALGLKKALFQSDRDLADGRLAAARRLGELRARQAVEPLISALQDPSAGMRAHAAEALGKIGDPRAVEALLARLSEYDWQVSQSVIPALGEIGDGRAAQPVVDQLGNSGRRALSSEALARIGSPAVEALIPALQSKDPEVRKISCETLGKIGDGRAAQPLIAVLQDERNDVRKSAAGALDGISWKPGNDESAAIYWIVKEDWEKVVATGASAVRPLMTCIEAEYGTSRTEAAKALGEIGAPAVEALIIALRSKHNHVRRTAAEILGETCDRRALEPLIALLSDASCSDQDRAVAAKALGKLKESAALEPLLAALEDEDSSVRAAAAEGLGDLGDPRAVKPLLTAIRDEDSNISICAAIALGAIGAPAVEPLIRLLGDPASQVREAAARGLSLTGDGRAIAPLVKALEDEVTGVRQAAVNGLGKIGSDRAVEPLLAALKDKVGAVRYDAVYALGSIKDARAIPPLLSELKSEPLYKKYVTDALDKIGWIPGKDASGAAYWIARRDWEKCAETGAPAIPPLVALLQDDSKDIRAGAARALAQIYRTQPLSPDEKSLIFAQRNAITQKHEDSSWSSDCGGHSDKGIGIAFP